MSKQHSQLPDEPEQPRHTGGSRKPKPWALWVKLPAIGSRGKAKWFRKGRYVAKELAVEASTRGISVHFECRVMHETEGKPE